MKNQTLGKTIALLRKSKGYTQMELAEMIGVSDKAISRWERDETSPDISALINLADEFGVTIDDLIKGNVQLTNSDDKENDGDADDASDNQGNGEAAANTAGPVTFTPPMVDPNVQMLKNKMETYKKVTFISYVVMFITFSLSFVLKLLSVPVSIVYLVLFIVQISSLRVAKPANEQDVDLCLKSDHYIELFSRSRNFLVVMATLQGFNLGFSIAWFVSALSNVKNMFSISADVILKALIVSAVFFIISSLIYYAIFKIILRVKKLIPKPRDRALERTGITAFVFFIVASIAISIGYLCLMINNNYYLSSGQKFYDLNSFVEANDERKYDDKYEKLLGKTGDVLLSSTYVSESNRDKLKEYFATGAAAYAFTDEGYDAYMQTNEEIRSYFLIGWIACTAVILIGYVISKRRC